VSETAEFLKRLGFFQGLSDEELVMVAALCTLAKYRSGDTIVAIGDPADSFYLIQRGSVQIITRAEADDQVGRAGDAVRLSLGRGQAFGEMALVDGGPRSATARASSDVAVYVIKCADLIALCEQFPSLGYRVMRNVAVDLSFKLRQRNLM
jgi:CRP/FNR family transcriptional regulator, cyclic AMP receptor protein